jgi:hypothetical protein
LKFLVNLSWNLQIFEWTWVEIYKFSSEAEPKFTNSSNLRIFEWT